MELPHSPKMQHQGLDFLSNMKQPRKGQKYEMMVSKTLDVRQQRTVSLERWKANKCALQLAQLTEEFPGCATGRRNSVRFQ